MKAGKTSFGQTKSGESVDLLTLENGAGMTVSFMTYGGIIVSVKAADRNGKAGEISPGFDSVGRYEEEASVYLGALIGRFANRIRNGKFAFDGREYELQKNWLGKHHLHGGSKGFDKAVWIAEAFERNGAAGAELFYRSADGEGGYPGNLDAWVTYTLTDTNEFIIEYRANADAPTPVNLSSHVYWNLAGAGTVEGHELMLNSGFFLPVDEDMCVTGEILKVDNTPMDFTRPKMIGRDLARVDAGGYDHCFCVDRKGDGLEFAARLYEPDSGRVMEMYTTMPGFHFYSGNFLDNLKGRNGDVYPQFGALALESGFFPDCVNIPHFQNCILLPGRQYNHKTMFKFFTA